MPCTPGWHLPVAFKQQACHAEILFLNIVILLVFGKPQSQCQIAAISHGAYCLSTTAQDCPVGYVPVLASSVASADHELGAVACPSLEHAPISA